MSSTEDTGNQCHSNNHVEPFLNNFTIHAGGLDQYEGQHCTEDQFPCSLNPEMDSPPPPVLIKHQVGWIVEGEEEEDRQTQKTCQQNDADNCLTTGENGHSNVKEEAQYHYYHTYFGDRWHLKEFSSHRWQQIIHGELSQS